MNSFTGYFVILRQIAAISLVAVGRHPARPAAESRVAPVLALVMAMGCAAAAGSINSACAREPDGVQRLVPAPSAGIEVEFWSDPPAGSLVHPGSQARLYARANADCYLTVFSVDSEGRARLLYPHPFEEGWIRGGRTYRLPESGSGFDLRFAGPPGMEYVYALASFHPTRSRYPSWMASGMEPMPPVVGSGDDRDLYCTGRVTGDPFYEVRDFCEGLVPYPEQRDSYATAWVYFHLGRRVPYPRFLCSDCHWGGAVDPYGPVCPAVQIRVGDVPCSGYIDFSLAWYPRYTYQVWTGWRPRGWHGGRWIYPGGHQVWSSADGRRALRGHFPDACPPVHHAPGPRGRDVQPPGPNDNNGWVRGFEERLRRAVGDQEDRRSSGKKSEPDRRRDPEVRNASPDPGVSSQKPPSPPDRGNRGGDRKREKDSAPRTPERSPKERAGTADRAENRGAR